MCLCFQHSFFSVMNHTMFWKGNLKSKSRQSICLSAKHSSKTFYTHCLNQQFLKTIVCHSSKLNYSLYRLAWKEKKVRSIDPTYILTFLYAVTCDNILPYYFIKKKFRSIPICLAQNLDDFLSRVYFLFLFATDVLFFLKFIYFFIIHMCIQCLGHFFPLPQLQQMYS
jgi:hypothetical protein